MSYTVLVKFCRFFYRKACEKSNRRLSGISGGRWVGQGERFPLRSISVITPPPVHNVVGTVGAFSFRANVFFYYYFLDYESNKGTTAKRLGSENTTLGNARASDGITFYRERRAIARE